MTSGVADEVTVGDRLWVRIIGFEAGDPKALYSERFVTLLDGQLYLSLEGNYALDNELDPDKLTARRALIRKILDAVEVRRVNQSD